MEPMRVLFVDDEHDLVSAVVERLEIRGFAAEGVTSGSEALERIESESFDVVVADVKMPGLDGLQLARIVGQRHPKIRIILLSGHGSSEDVEEGRRLGVVDYLQKPIEIETLVELLSGTTKGGL
ncbi:MAG: response regulator [Acidobacteriota bacterium]|jgi:DNA-binding response OmpR family regulator